MIRIIILNSLRDEIWKTFKRDSMKVYALIATLERNPNRGKVLGHAGGMSLRELRYKGYRFYFIVDGHKLILFNAGKIRELLIRFIKMSKKDNQQSTIDEIKRMLEFTEKE